MQDKEVTMQKIKSWLKKYINIIRGKGKPSRKLVKDVQGSVTILLLVIMLPMLVFSFSILDICKIFLAKDMIATSTDLALKSAMTSYDDVLKDMYGILATSKDEEELTENMNNYYVATLKSCGIEVDDNGKSLEFITNVFNTGLDKEMENNNNMLKVFPGAEINGKNVDPITVSGVEESAASNPEVLRRQIVEYMKYRGPVVMAAGLFEKINAFKDLPAQANATNKKIEFDKSLNDISDKSITAYTMLRVYDYNNKILEGKTADLSDMYAIKERQKIIDKYKYTYNQSFPLEKIKSNNSHDSDLIDSIKTLQTAAVELAAISDFVEYFGNKGTGSLELITLQHSKENNYDFKGKMDEAYKAITESTNSDIKSIYDKINTKKVETELSNLRSICEQIVYSNNTTENNVGVLLFTNFAPMFKLGSYQPEETDFSKLCKQFMSDYEKLKKDKEELDEKYTTLYDDIQSAEEKIKSKAVEFYQGAETKFNSAVTNLNKLYDAMAKQNQLLEDLLKNDNSLDKVLIEFKKAKTNANDYESSINSIENENQKNSYMADYEANAKNIKDVNEDDINKIKAALSEQQEVYSSALSSIKSIKFLGKSIINKESYNTKEHITTEFKDFTKNFSLDFSVAVTNLDESSDDVVTYSEFSSNNAKNYNNWTDFFDKATDKGKNTFYQLLEEISKPKENETGKKEGENIKEKVTEKVDVEKDGQPKTPDTTEKTESGSSDKESESNSVIPYNSDFNPNEIDSFSEFYSTQTKDNDNGKELSTMSNGSNNNKDMANNAQGMLESVQVFFGDLGKNIGDSIYITEYINQMFSCYTTSMDGKGHRDNDEKMMSGYYFYDSANNKANVEWYGAEQEYILYGKDSPEANLACAGAAIFGVRFVLNLIYSYTDSEINTFAMSVATASAGLFPFAVPLVKTVIHIGLSIAESAYDLMQLKKGADVPIYKTPSTWVCKGSNIVREIASDAIESVTNTVVDVAADKLSKVFEEGVEKINDFQKDKFEEFNELLNEEKEELKKQAESDLILPLQTALQQCIISYCDLGEEDLKSKLEEAMTQACNSTIVNLGLGGNSDDESDDDNILKAAEIEAIKFIQSKISKYADEIAVHIKDYIGAATGIKLSEFDEGSKTGDYGNFAQMMKTLFNDSIDKISESVENLNNKISEKLNSALNDLVAKEKKGIKVGADKIKESISEACNNLRGQGHLNTNISTKAGKTKTSSIIGMSYQDYLTIFTLVSVISGANNQLERAAKLMTGNIRKVSGKSDYDLNKACTVLKAESSASVKTVFFGAVFEDGKFNFSTNPGKYCFTYDSYLGY